MQTMTAAEAKQKFGQLIDMSHKGAVAITKHGRQVAVLISNEDYELVKTKKKDALMTRLNQSVQDIKDGKGISAESLENDLAALFESRRAG